VKYTAARTSPCEGSKTCSPPRRYHGRLGERAGTSETTPSEESGLLSELPSSVSVSPPARTLLVGVRVAPSVAIEQSF